MSPQGRPGRGARRPGHGGGRGGSGRADPGGRRGGRPEGLGGTQVEGRQAVRELLAARRRRVREVLLAEDIEAAAIVAEIADLAREARVPVQHVSRGRLDGAAATSAPQGVIARAAPVPEDDLADLARPLRRQRPFLVVLDGVTDPQNLGALLRSAHCAGCTGVVLPRHRAAHLTPAAVKAAAGAVEHLRFALVPGIPNALADLAGAGVWAVGLDAGAPRSVFDLELATEPVALVLGAEGEGLSRLVRDRCDALVAIPLQGQLDSLNVGAAGAVACFEVVRRRLAAGGED